MPGIGLLSYCISIVVLKDTCVETRKTNELLRRRSEGVAKNSYHIKGMAVDINVPNVSLRRLRDIAIGLQRGGVGYYPRHGFVHVDVGPVRTWRRG